MKKDFNDGDAWFISCTGSGTMAASMEFSRLSAFAEYQHYKTSSALVQESLTNKSIIAWTSAQGMKAVRAEPFDLPFVLSEVEGQAQGER